MDRASSLGRSSSATAEVKTIFVVIIITITTATILLRRFLPHEAKLWQLMSSTSKVRALLTTAGKKGSLLLV